MILSFLEEMGGVHASCVRASMSNAAPPFLLPLSLLASSSSSSSMLYRPRPRAGPESGSGVESVYVLGFHAAEREGKEREVKWKVGNEMGNGESEGGGRQATRKVRKCLDQEEDREAEDSHPGLNAEKRKKLPLL